MHGFRVSLKVILSLVLAFLMSCSPPSPPPVVTQDTPPPPPEVPVLPILGKLPSITFTNNAAQVTNTEELLGNLLLFWFHHPVTEASVEQGKALKDIDPGSVFRKFVLVPMPNTTVPFPRMQLPFDAEIVACPPQTRAALGDLKVIPTILLTDREGNIRFRQEGNLDPSEIAAAISSISNTR